MSGIAILRRLLMKQAMKKSAGSSGIMSLNKNLVKDIDTQVAKWVDSAKRQGADIDKMSEQELKYVIELNKPKPIKAVPANSPEGEILTRDLFNMLDRQSGKNVIKTDFGGGVTDIVTETIAVIKSKKPIDAMKEANSVIGRKGKYKNLTEEQSQKILKETNDHIFERDIPIDPEDFAHGGRTGSGLNYLLGEDDQNSRVPYASGSRKKESWTNKLTRWAGGPSMVAGDLGFEGLHQIYNLLGMGGLYAEGGRTGFGLGGMGRRAFLKMMGAGAAGVGAAKSGLLSIFKGGATKSVIKDLTSVPIKAGVDGMPAWFKPLVNKVIKQGDDVSKKAATGERQIVHKDVLPDGDEVTVTQHLDNGNVDVSVSGAKNDFHISKTGHGEQNYTISYVKGETIIGKNNKPIKVKDKMETDEGYMYSSGPDRTDMDIDFDIVDFTEKTTKHDTSVLNSYATGKKIKSKKTQPLEDMSPEGDWDDSLDFASGGRVPLAEGNTPSSEQLQQYYEEIEKQKERERLQRQLYEQRFGGPGPVLEASQGGLAGLLGE